MCYTVPLKKNYIMQIILALIENVTIILNFLLYLASLT